VDVAAGSLVRLYRDTPHMAHDTYTGRRIRVTLAPRTYRVERGVVGYPTVGWLTGFADTPPAVVFVVEPPPDDSATLEIVGTCRGRVDDGHRRGNGVNFHVLVDGCSLFRHAAP
jgi:hypothetical protein